MLEQIQAEKDISVRAKLLKEYLKGEVKILELAKYLRSEIQNSESKAWVKFCQEIQKYLQKQFPASESKKQEDEFQLPSNFQSMSNMQKLAYLDDWEEKDITEIRKFLSSHPELVLTQKDARVFRKMLSIMGKQDCLREEGDYAPVDEVNAAVLSSTVGKASSGISRSWIGAFMVAVLGFAGFYTQSGSQSLQKLSEVLSNSGEAAFVQNVQNRKAPQLESAPELSTVKTVLQLKKKLKNAEPATLATLPKNSVNGLVEDSGDRQKNNNSQTNLSKVQKLHSPELASDSQTSINPVSINPVSINTEHAPSQTFSKKTTESDLLIQAKGDWSNSKAPKSPSLVIDSRSAEASNSASDGLGMQDSIQKSTGLQTFLLAGVEKEGRADAVLLVSSLNDNLRILSLPRDTKVTIDRKNKIQSAKLNHTHRWGGVKLLRQAVSSLFPDLEIQDHVVVDLGLFRKFIDLIGGVALVVQEDMQYEDKSANFKIDIKKGPQLLDGEKAEAFVRFRADGLGDLGRVERQQKFLKALQSRLQGLKDVNLENVKVLGKIPSFFLTVVKDVSTDMSAWKLSQLVLHSRKIDTDQIEFRTLRGEGRYEKKENGEGLVNYYISDPVSRVQSLKWLEHSLESAQGSSSTTNSEGLVQASLGAGRKG